jgi:hypothetical protein
MDKYAVSNVNELQRQELKSVKEQIASYVAEGDGLSKAASADLDRLLERSAELEEAIAAEDAA